MVPVSRSNSSTDSTIPSSGHTSNTLSQLGQYPSFFHHRPGDPASSTNQMVRQLGTENQENLHPPFQLEPIFLHLFSTPSDSFHQEELHLSQYMFHSRHFVSFHIRMKLQKHKLVAKLLKILKTFLICNYSTVLLLLFRDKIRKICTLGLSICTSFKKQAP